MCRYSLFVYTCLYTCTCMYSTPWELKAEPHVPTCTCVHSLCIQYKKSAYAQSIMKCLGCWWSCVCMKCAYFSCNISLLSSCASMAVTQDKRIKICVWKLCWTYIVRALRTHSVSALWKCIRIDLECAYYCIPIHAAHGAWVTDRYWDGFA